MSANGRVSLPLTNDGEPEAGFFCIPFEVRKDIYKYAFGGHLILPRPDEPNKPSPEAREELGRLFSKIKAATDTPAFNKITNMTERFEAIVHAAIYGRTYGNEAEGAAIAYRVNTFFGFICSCKLAYHDAIKFLYQANIWDMNLLIPPSGANPKDSNYKGATDQPIYMPQPKVPGKYLSSIRALHLSTRPLANTSKLFASCPSKALGNIKHLVITCATTCAPHIPSGEVRHHIPHGKDWIALWTEITKPGKLKSLETIEVNVCGWRVPPGWRMEVIAPVREAALALGRLPRESKRKAIEDDDVKPLKGVPLFNPDCQVKEFDVYVPWTREIVDAHNEKSAHTYGFRLLLDEHAINHFNEKTQNAGPEGRIDPGFIDG